MYQSNGNRKALRRRKIAHNPNYIPSSVKSREGNVIACLAASRSRPLVFIDDVTSNRSSEIKTETTPRKSALQSQLDSLI